MLDGHLSPGAGLPPVTEGWRSGRGGPALRLMCSGDPDLLEVAEDASRRRCGLRRLPQAAGLSTDRAKVETPAAEAEAAGEQGWLAEEAGPGLFALPRPHGAGEAAKRG